MLLCMYVKILGKLPRKQSSKSSDDNSNIGVSNRKSFLSNRKSDYSASANISNRKSDYSASAKSSNLGSRSSNGIYVSHKLSAGESNKGMAAQVGPVLNSDKYEALPSFQDVPKSEKHNLFIRKLNMCCVVFDFTDPLKNLKEKDIKRCTLLELVDFVSSVTSNFNEIAMQKITTMTASNMLRALPSSNLDKKLPVKWNHEEEEQVYDPQEQAAAMEPAWPHLHVVYDLLYSFIDSPETDAQLAKRHIDHSFVLRLLDLFDSEDQREREYVMIILHRVYGKFRVHRRFIRKAINNIFYRFIFETEKHNGIAELLEILGSIIKGLVLPLKEEHKLFIVRVLVPLHKPKCVSMYHQQLSYCITQFVEKDSELADPVIRGLLKYWPVTNSSKEVMFLCELEEVLGASHAAEWCMVPLFRQIGRCLNSSHHQVAERALFLWNNDHIRNLTVQNRKVILPIIFPALERNTRSHWYQPVQHQTSTVRKIFSEVDQELFEKCLLKFQEDEIIEEEIHRKWESTLKCLEDVAASKAHLSMKFGSQILC